MAKRVECQFCSGYTTLASGICVKCAAETPEGRVIRHARVRAARVYGQMLVKAIGDNRKLWKEFTEARLNMLRVGAACTKLLSVHAGVELQAIRDVGDVVLEQLRADNERMHVALEEMEAWAKRADQALTAAGLGETRH